MGDPQRDPRKKVGMVRTGRKTNMLCQLYQTEQQSMTQQNQPSCVGPNEDGGMNVDVFTNSCRMPAVLLFFVCC